MPFIETERLRMVPFTLELMKAAVSDRAKLSELLQAKVPESWPNPDFAEVLPFLIANLELHPDQKIWNGVILSKKDSVLVGDMGLKGGPDETGTADMGYSTVPEFQGQGYATEMACGLIKWSFEEAGLNRITAECLSDNIGSIRVLEKSGLRRLDPEENMLKWEIRRSDTV
jgi:ribosomal-protein-alanine N-acetyltransferase